MNWRTVEIAPGYEISDCGAVRNMATGRLLKPWAHKSGHLYIGCGKAGRFQVHHLVMAAFGPPRPPGQECRHLDDKPNNNRIENLAWGTRAQNIADHVRLRGKFPHSLTTLEGRVQIAAALKHATRGGRQQIADQFGVTIHVVNHIASRRGGPNAVAKAA